MEISLRFLANLFHLLDSIHERFVFCHIRHVAMQARGEREEREKEEGARERGKQRRKRERFCSALFSGTFVYLFCRVQGGLADCTKDAGWG